MGHEHVKHSKHDQWATPDNPLALMRLVNDGARSYFDRRFAIGVELLNIRNSLADTDIPKDRVDTVVQYALSQDSQCDPECVREHCVWDCGCEARWSIEKKL